MDIAWQFLVWLRDGSNLAALVAALSAAAAVFRYWQVSARNREDQRKAQASVAVAEMLRFLTDEDVRTALSALDYAEPVAMRALRIHASTYETDAAGAFSIQEKQARDHFDQFLTRLESIDFLIEHKVIAEADFREQFNYWLELLGEIPKAGDQLTHFSDINRAALWTYIRTYHFNGVIRLFARYGRASRLKGMPEALFERRVVAPAST